jgi:hypothetical protein
MEGGEKLTKPAQMGPPKRTFVQELALEVLGLAWKEDRDPGS